MKLLTLNCHSWQEENQIDKIKYLAEVINQKDYDVIALQEVSQSVIAESIDSKLKKDNFALLLKEELDRYSLNKYNFYWDFSHIGYDVYEEGLAIFTKHKIIDYESFFVTKNNDRSYWKTRKIIRMRISYNDRELDFYSCHIGWWNDEEEPFKNQIDNIMKRVNETTAFIMGDFNNNAFIKGEGYDYLIEKGLKDLYLLSETKDSGVTVKGKIAGWDDNEEKLRLDLMFCNKEIKVMTIKVIFNGKNKAIISDHYGVESEIDMNF